MRTLPLLGVIATLAFCGVFASSYAQIADYVVINEVDTNPPGDDAKSVVEWVELYNPTDKDVDIGGWQIASTSVARKTLTLSSGTTIKAGQHLVFGNTILWFTDVSERVQLKNKAGDVIDETPTISDQKNDANSWQRKYDGYDTNSSNDWTFRTSNAGSSNGKIGADSADVGQLTVTVATDKKDYLFSETAVISGTVSEQIYQVKPFFSQQQIEIVVKGPGNYQKKFSMYPDLNLNYKTSLKLDKVQGIIGGTYTVSVSYGSAQDTAIFTVGDKVAETVGEQESELAVYTDNIAYIPGQRVSLLASTNKIIPLEGLKLVIYDAKGKQVFSGSLYPNTKGEFSTTMFVSTVNPIYGRYNVVADYGRQHAETTFDVLQDVKDLSQIVLTTDKKVYGMGEPIVITGRSNKYVAALDIEILQTGTGSVGKTVSNIFKVKDQVKLAGDSTFRYELNVPAGQSNLGDFKVTVSKEFGSATTTFKIVENPDQYVYAENKNFVTTDKAEYKIDEKATIMGHVILKQRTTFAAIPVQISVEDSMGKPISFYAKDTKLRIRDDSLVAQYSFTAIPDPVGNYKVDIQLSRAVFPPGKYFIKANYDGTVTTTDFTVREELDVTNKDLVVKLDKTVYGLGETVKMEGTLVAGQSGVKITLTRPDGKTEESGAHIDKSRFSWSWKTPIKEFAQADIRDPKEVRPTVFGNYKITVKSASQTVDVFFKVSQNPETDTLVVKPLEVSTGKQTYAAGEKLLVTGAAIKREQVKSTLGGIPERVNVQIRTSVNKVIYDSSLPLDAGGYFRATYDLPLTVFKDGTYKVTAIYQKTRAETTFNVKNNLPLESSGKTILLVTTDKEEYTPGERVQIVATTNRISPLQKLDLVVIPEESTAINCGTANCGLGGKKTDIARSYNNGMYSYEYVIPVKVEYGTYLVKVDAEFGTFTKTFQIVPKKAEVPAPVIVSTISEKFNRLPESEIPIFLASKTLDGKSMTPISLQGSVITSRGQEQNVNLRIIAPDGQCVIGQEAMCLVSGPTTGTSVMIGKEMYNVEYSGHDKPVEKFFISSTAVPDSVWIVQIVKGEQQSRFYYEILYNAIQ